MREDKTTLEKRLRDVTRTQFGTDPPDDCEQNTIRRECKKIEGSSSSFVEGTATLRTEECEIPKFGFLRPLLGISCSAMGAVHWPTFLFESRFDTISIAEVCLTCQSIV